MINTKCLTEPEGKLQLIPALYMFAWGVWLLIPNWDTFSTATVFFTMRDLAPEWAWGAFAALLGFLQILFIIIEKPKVCRWLSLLSLFSFVTISILSIHGNFKSAAIPAHLVMALASLLAYGEILEKIKLKG